MDSTPSHFSHTMSSADGPYSQQQQAQSQQWSQQSPSHLLPPTQSQSSFPSPSTPASSLNDQPYSSYFNSSHQSAQNSMHEPLTDRPGDKTALSLNLSSLSVTSPTNLSPINPSPHPSTHASSHVSPITPISPSGNSLVAHHHPHHTHHPHIQQPFQFAPPDQGIRYDDGHYDSYGKRLTSSRSSSSSEKSVPRKRSYTTLAPLTTSVEETPYDLGDNPNSAMYDEVDMSYGPMDAEGSPIDGSNSGGEQDEQMKPMEGQLPTSTNTLQSGAPPSLGVLNKPLGTNNFVTKLYQ